MAADISDQPPRLARPPRALCEALLTELTHSSWEPLASLAARLLPVLLAPGDLDTQGAHEEAQAIIAAACDLIASLPAGLSPLPFPALASLHRVVRQDVTFAPAERSREPVTMNGLRWTVERARAPSPRWAIELLWGEHWRSAGTVRHALPWPGLIRLDALHDDIAPDDARIGVGAALRDRAQAMSTLLTEAASLSRVIEDRRPDQRSTSRAPALFELLAGFGPLRGAQIEALLSATRLGVRSMLAALDAMGALERSTISGVRLYAVSPPRQAIADGSQASDGFAFSTEALGDYNASMAHIEALLARSGTDRDDAEE
jgi:hypothetical protein